MLLAAAVGALPPVAARCAAAHRVSTSSVCAQPVAPRQQRRAVHSSALRLNRPRRPRWRSWRRWLGAKACAPAAGFRCAPPCALACRAARSSRRQARPPAGSRHSIVLSRWRLAPPAALCRRRPARPVVLRAAAVGGACFRRPKGRTLRAPPLPPRPPFFAGGGAHWFALRRV